MRSWTAEPMPGRLHKCPNCSGKFAAEPYDIGSGPEVCCPNCDTCFGANGQPLNGLDPVRSFTSRQELVSLLEEWMDWWSTSDAPAKLPEALHVRTAVVLQLASHDPELTVESRHHWGDIVDGREKAGG